MHVVTAATARGLGRASLALEDVVVGGWLALAAPLVGTLGGGRSAFDLRGDADPLIGALYLVAIVGGLVCLVTRGRGDPLPGPDPGTSARGYAPFPLAAAMSIVGVVAFEKLGATGGDLVAPVSFGAAFVGFLAQARLPVLEPAVRRALMAPYLVISASIAQGFGADLWRGIQPSALMSLGVASLLILGTAVFYVMFVFAPRQLVEPATPARAWLPRYGLFVLAYAIGAGWLVAFGG